MTTFDSAHHCEHVTQIVIHLIQEITCTNFPSALNENETFELQQSLAERSVKEDNLKNASLL